MSLISAQSCTVQVTHASIIYAHQHHQLHTGTFYVMKHVLQITIYTVSEKTETRVISNILYSCKSIAMKFSTRYHDGLSY